MRVAIYCRVSTKDKGQDTTNQLLQLQQFCKRQGWTVVQVYKEEASGRKGERDRETFRQVFVDAAKRKWDCLLFWSLDRLTRQGALATLKYLSRLSELGIGYRSYSEEYLNTMGVFGDVVIAPAPHRANGASKRRASRFAEWLRIPFVTLSNAVIGNPEPGIPPLFTTWPYSTSFVARFRNKMAHRMAAKLATPWRNLINARRREWKLREYRTLWESTSPFAHISQQPAWFDFPRREMPVQFHYTGPWHDRKVRPELPFPYEKLDGRRLIYASMGTLQNRVREVFREIAEACNGLDTQLVIALGGGSTPEEVGPLPGDPLVVEMAPQLELLSRASLVITHAGLNTALESLSYGVPMVAIPVGNDQPGVAARLKWVGAAEFLPLTHLKSAKLRPLINQVLDQPQYRQRAQEAMTEIQKAKGVERAVDFIEEVLISQRGRAQRSEHQALSRVAG